MANGTASTNGTWPIKNPTPDIDWNLVSKSQRTREACLFLFNFLRFHFDCLFCFSSFRNFARVIPLISKKMWNAIPFCLRAVHETGGDGISMLADDLDIPELIMANLEPSEMRPLLQTRKEKPIIILKKWVNKFVFSKFLINQIDINYYHRSITSYSTAIKRRKGISPLCFNHLRSWNANSESAFLVRTHWPPNP